MTVFPVHLKIKPEKYSKKYVFGAYFWTFFYSISRNTGYRTLIAYNILWNRTSTRTFARRHVRGAFPWILKELQMWFVIRYHPNTLFSIDGLIFHHQSAKCSVLGESMRRATCEMHASNQLNLFCSIFHLQSTVLIFDLLSSFAELFIMSARTFLGTDE